MRSEKIHLKSGGKDVSKILELIESFSYELDLDDRNMLRIRLLGEELVGLVNSMDLEFDAEFWMEYDNVDDMLHLDLRTLVNPARQKEFLALSKSDPKKPKGIMARIKGIVQNMMVSIDEADQLQLASTQGVPYAMYGMMDAESSRVIDSAMVWSLQRYRSSVDQNVKNDEEAITGHDDLEKSVIANIADDVSVGIKDSRVSLVVTKKL